MQAEVENFHGTTCVWGPMGPRGSISIPRLPQPRIRTFQFDAIAVPKQSPKLNISRLVLDSVEAARLPPTDCADLDQAGDIAIGPTQRSLRIVLGIPEQGTAPTFGQLPKVCAHILARRAEVI